MFLFNPSRNSRQLNTSGNEVININWKTDLRTYPVYGAESTATLDNEGNLYFGSHSGNFYSLDKQGNIRWVFTTKSKIYSSPVLIENKVYFAGGDGIFYALNIADGTLHWKHNLSDSLNLNRKKKLKSLIQHLPFTFDLKRKKNITFKSWASPNSINNKLFITGYGKGISCYNLQGDLLWEYDLGFPRFQLSGVAINNSGNIFCASRRGFVYSFSENGDIIWKHKAMKFGEPWANPVVCNITNNVYFSFSKAETKGKLFCYSSDGKYLWSTKIGAIRGSTAISKTGNELFCCDLDGFIYKIKSDSGEILSKKQITHCPRGLWITPTFDNEGNILLATKDDGSNGRVIKMTPDFEFIWTFKTNKVLSVPLILENGDVLFGSWDGYYYSIKTQR